MTPLLSDKHATLAQAGSYWYLGIAPRDQRLIRTMSELRGYCKTPFLLQGVQNVLEGAGFYEDVHVTLHFSPVDVVQLGADIQRRITIFCSDDTTSYVLIRKPDTYDLGLRGKMSVGNEDGLTLEGENGQFLLLPIGSGPGVSGITINPEDLYLRYLVPIEHGFKPIAITTPRRDMVAGLDFIAGDGFLIFNEPPDILFPDWRILVRCGHREARSLFNYTLQVDGGASCYHVANYYRNNQSAAAFQLAIAEAAGYCILPWSGTLLEIHLYGGETRYVFNSGVLVVHYNHAALTVGEDYPKDYIIGQGVNVYSKTSSTGQWWRQVTWNSGLCLDNLCPVKGLTIQDQPARAWANSQSTDYHARIDFLGPPAALNAFWALVQQNEVLTGKYLNTVIGLTSLTDEVILNPLDLYFTCLLGSRGIIIQLNAAGGEDYRRRALQFIHREKPVGSVPIIINT